MMKKDTIYFLLPCLGLMLLSSTLLGQSLSKSEQVLRLMGSRFEFIAFAEKTSVAEQAIQDGIAEVQRIEKLISSWDGQSQTSLINQNAGYQSTKVDQELFNLIYRAKKVSQLTKGAFDISFAAMNKIWKFDGSMKNWPNQDSVKASVANVNWEHIQLDADQKTVYLKEKGMKIGFGAIGKGYAANKAMEVMKKVGIKGALVNAGGDLLAWGKSDNEKGWPINIANPNKQTEALAWLNIKDMAIVTSGDYERFFTFEGKRYAHIIDPRTGYPCSGIKSVTVLCPDAELADALATAVFVLGKEEGLALINQLKGIEGLVVTDENEILSSSNLKLNYY